MIDVIIPLKVFIDVNSKKFAGFYTFLVLILENLTGLAFANKTMTVIRNILDCLQFPFLLRSVEG